MANCMKYVFNRLINQLIWHKLYYHNKFHQNYQKNQQPKRNGSDNLYKKPTILIDIIRTDFNILEIRCIFFNFSAETKKRLGLSSCKTDKIETLAGFTK